MNITLNAQRRISLRNIVTLFILGVVLCLTPFPSYAATWSERTGAGSRNWISITSSSDGTNLAAVNQNGYVYTSNDSGANWADLTAAGSREWSSITSSANGGKLAAAVANDDIYIRDGFGGSWSSTPFAPPPKTWVSIAASSDATKLAAAAAGGTIWTSSNSGNSWTEQTAAGVKQWSSITSSADGTKLAATAGNNYIFTSTDSGVTWATSTTAGIRDWKSITSSSDGTKLAAVVNNGYIYTSSDSGATWTEQTASGVRNWLGITSSSDGTRLAAVANSGYIYTSVDSGSTWTAQTSSGSRNWYGITSSSDGTKLAAVVMGGSIWTASLSSTPVLSSILAAANTSTATITWTTDIPADSHVSYGLTSGYGSNATDVANVTSHSIELSGLSSCTTYHYAVTSNEPYDLAATSTDATFTTTGCPAPVLSSVVATPSRTTATITWTTDLSSNSSVYYGISTAYGATTTDSASVTSHSVNLSSLVCNTTYHFQLSSVDSAHGVTGTTTDSTFTTTACASSGGGGGGGGGGGSSKSKTTTVTPIATTTVSGVTPVKAITPVSNVFKFLRDLDIGAQGTDVTELQNRLTREGVYSGPISGYFGPLTFAAVKAYQSKMGIMSSGSVGPLTREKLNAGQVISVTTGNNAAVLALIEELKAKLVILMQQLIELRKAEAAARN